MYSVCEGEFSFNTLFQAFKCFHLRWIAEFHRISLGPNSHSALRFQNYFAIKSLNNSVQNYDQVIIAKPLTPTQEIFGRPKGFRMLTLMFSLIIIIYKHTHQHTHTHLQPHTYTHTHIYIYLPFSNSIPLYYR